MYVRVDQTRDDEFSARFDHVDAGSALHGAACANFRDHSIADENLGILKCSAARSVNGVRERVQPWVGAGATRLLIPTVPVTDDPVAETKEFLKLWKL